MSHRRTFAAAAVAIAGAAAVATPAVVDANSGKSRTRTYEVTIENLTPADSQPFSPPATVIHRRAADVWSVGAPASAALAAVAEDANIPVFVSTYEQVRGVRDVVVGSDAPVVPGGSVTFEIDARRGDRLSLVSMLVNTNDAFTGLDAVKLTNKEKVYEVGAYDAGSEANNELTSHIPGPAGGNPFVRDPEGGVVSPHPGILGVGDIDELVYDWDEPVARITITPVD